MSARLPEVVAVASSHAAPGLVEPQTLELARTAALGVLGHGLLAGVVAATIALVVRGWSVRELPSGPAILCGVGVSSAPLVIDAVGRGTVVEGVSLTHHASGGYLLAVVTVGTATAEVGRRLGDHLAYGVFELPSIRGRGTTVSLIRSGALAMRVTLPASIDDADGYLPVTDRVKRSLSNESFLLPRRLTGEQLEERLRTRVESDYDVDRAFVNLGPDGAIDSLAVGRQRTGLGSTLPPDRVAVAIDATVSPRAGSADPVEVWSDDGESLVATGRVRANSGSTTTLIVDEDDATAFENRGRYRLSVRPSTPSDAHEFAALVRAAVETVTIWRVEPDGPLERTFVGWLPGTVLVLDRSDGICPLPADSEPLRAGDVVYVLGTPTESPRRDIR